MYKVIFGQTINTEKCTEKEECLKILDGSITLFWQETKNKLPYSNFRNVFIPD